MHCMHERISRSGHLINFRRPGVQTGVYVITSAVLTRGALNISLVFGAPLIKVVIVPTFEATVSKLRRDY